MNRQPIFTAKSAPHTLPDVACDDMTGCRCPPMAMAAIFISCRITMSLTQAVRLHSLRAKPETRAAVVGLVTMVPFCTSLERQCSTAHLFAALPWPKPLALMEHAVWLHSSSKGCCWKLGLPSRRPIFLLHYPAGTQRPWLASILSARKIMPAGLSARLTS